jgi:hypothetical protein
MCRQEPAMKILQRALITFIAWTIIPLDIASAQQVVPSASVQTRTRAIAASFSKHKHVVKEKRGIRVEKYKDIRSEPAVRADPQDYSGTYEVPDMGFAIQLQVDQSGNVTGTGYEPTGPDLSVRRRFTLKNGKVEGALLSATLVYADGKQDRFEGVFMNRIAFDSPTDKGVAAFGLGVIGKNIALGGLTVDKLFYELKQ